MDVTLHPELVAKYGAQTVPFFVWGERLAFPGPLPELVLLQRLSAGAAEE